MNLPPDPLARSAGLAGAATLTSRILGLARDQVLATLFGAGMATLVGAAKLLRIAEFDDALAIVRERARKLLAR